MTNKHLHDENKTLLCNNCARPLHLTVQYGKERNTLNALKLIGHDRHLHSHVFFSSECKI